MLSLDEIRTRLQDRNLEYVAQKVGCTRTYLHYVKTGKQSPSGNGEMLKRISDYLEGAQ